MQDVTGRPYYASVETAGDQFVAHLPLLVKGAPKTISAQGETQQEALSLLAQKLRQRINECQLHGESVEAAEYLGWFTVALEPAPATYDADAGKALLAYIQAESAAAEANVQLADSRARQNGLLALAALPVLNFLLAGQAPANLWESSLVLFSFLGIIGTLIYTLLGTRTRKLENVGITPDGLKQNMDLIDDGVMDQRYLLYRLQDSWLRSVRAYQPVADRKFEYVTCQMYTLALTFAPLLLLQVSRLP